MGDKHNQPKKVAQLSKVVGTYASHYNDKAVDETTVTMEERKKRKETVADSYYDFASAAYESGWSTHFHYTPFLPIYPPSDSTIATAMLHYEHRLAFLMHITPSSLVLDVGCGIGAPARSIARLTGCRVIGITINQGQVDRAIYLTALEGLSDRVSFVRGNFLDMPFRDGAFDAAVAVEATPHSPSLERVYKEINRVLKPGGMFGTSEWVLTNNYDENNEKHLRIRDRIHRGNGLVNLHTCDQAREAFVKAGFGIEHEEDFAAHFDYAKTTRSTQGSPILIPYKDSPRAAPPPSTPLPTPLPTPPTAIRAWTFPLRGQHALATTWTDWWTCFKMSPFMRRLGFWYVYVGETIGFVDKGCLAAMETMGICVDSVVEGGLEEIFSPCWWFIGRKVREGAEDARDEGEDRRGQSVQKGRE